MPVRHSIIHQIDKKPDGTPAVLHVSGTELAKSQATENLLKAFSDFVAAEDLHEDSTREKTQTLVSYSMAQAKIGKPITLAELSELIDEDRPRAF